jgi:pilus assembly protein CpaB
MTARKGGGARASRLGALGFTAVALVMTLLTAFLLARVMGDSKYANEPMREVVVAAKDIPASEVITEDHLKIVQWPVSSVPEGAFTRERMRDILGPQSRVPVSTILAGEVVLEARLASPKAGTGMASLVPPTMRAFPIPVDPWVAQARLVYPGAVVDVLATLRNAMDRKPSTKLVLQKVPVLAVDGAVDAASAAANDQRKNSGGVDKKAVVTLLVTPEQAESLALSSREGTVDLMLRNAGDDGIVETLGITPSELLGIPDEAEMEQAANVVATDARVREDARRPEPAAAPRRRAPAPTPTSGRRSPAEEAAARQAEENMGGGGGSKTIRLGAQ